jgi:predicted NAD-dependent protein-ADP-ribosyltransferase YbiA (DUF1768 family)
MSARVEELVRLDEAGAPPELLLFWGHRPPRTGGVGQGCLSQWYPAPFTVDGVRYATAEHYMMAGKARLFGDAEAERLGRVRHWQRTRWHPGSGLRAGT